MSLTRTGWAVMGAVLAAAACSRTQSTGPPPQMPPTPVTLVMAAAKPIEETTEYVAMLKSLRSTSIQPQIDGQITQILVKSGDRVRQGAPLMQIDPRRQQAAVSSQEAERAAREAAVPFASPAGPPASRPDTAGPGRKPEPEGPPTELRSA